MALYGNQDERLLIKEGTLSLGNVSSPQLIGTNNVDPLSFFSGQVLGRFKQGSLKPNIKRTWAEFLAGTPAILVAKALVRKQFMLELELGQFDAATIALSKGTLYVPNYNVATPAAKVVNLNWLGPDEPPVVKFAILLQAATIDGKPFRMMFFNTFNSADDVSLTESGTAFATNKVSFEAFPHPAFSGPTADQQSYGLIWDEVA